MTGELSRFLYYAVPASVALSSSSFAVRHMLLLRKAARTHHWPVADGKILHAEVRSGVGQIGTRVDDYLFTRLEYQYRVGQQNYRGSRLRLTEMSIVGAAQAVRRYQPGDAVLVRYDPENHTRAVLEPGATWHAVGLQVTAVVGALLSFGWLYVLAAVL